MAKLPGSTEQVERKTILQKQDEDERHTNSDERHAALKKRVRKIFRGKEAKEQNLWAKVQITIEESQSYTSSETVSQPQSDGEGPEAMSPLQP